MIILVTACNSGGAAAPSPDSTLLVAAASNLQFAFTEIGEKFEAQTGTAVTLSFSSSGNLATQIENGAPFDLFAAANEEFIDRLAAQGLILPDTRQVYAQGRLVLAVNRESGLQLKTLADLDDPAVTQIAIANPEHAPYGMAARQALANAGLWEQAQPRLVFGENVRQTLQFIQTGNAPAGIIARSIADVPEIEYTLIPAGLHQPLEQSLAVLKTAPHPAAARAFVKFVTGDDGRAIMKQYGFSINDDR